jgi:hypothetical protein
MTDPTRQSRWYRLTPDRCVVALLALEGFLLLSAWFRWLPFNQHKGWTVLIAIASVGVALLLMFLWFLAALLFRLRFQFSILALLLLVVVVAVPCSWLATEMKQARRQHRAVASLEQAGAFAWYDYTRYEVARDLDLPFAQSSFPIEGHGPITLPKLPAARWLRALLGEDFFANVDRVDFSREGRANNESLSQLTKLPGLIEVHLCRATDAGLEHLEKLPQLQELDIPDIEVTDAGLEHLRGLTQLRDLWLGSPRVTDAGVKKLQQALPKCTIYH